MILDLFELQAECMYQKDITYLNSIKEQWNIMHLFYLSKYYPKSKEKIDLIFHSLNQSHKSKFTYRMFRYMLSKPHTQNIISIFLTQAEIPKFERYSIFRYLLHLKDETQKIKTLLKIIHDRWSIFQLLIESRPNFRSISDWRRTSHSDVIEFMIELFDEEYKKKEWNHWILEYSYIWFLVYHGVKVYDSKIVSLLEHSRFLRRTEYMNIWYLLIGGNRIQEIQWLFHHFPHIFTYTMKSNILLYASNQSTSESFFEIISFLEEIQDHIYIRPYTCQHVSIWTYLVQMIMTKEEFIENIEEAFEYDHVVWLSCLYQKFPEWFQDYWQDFGPQMMEEDWITEFEIYELLYDKFQIKMSVDLFYSLFYQDNVMDRIEKMEILFQRHVDFIPTFVPKEKYYLIMDWSVEEVKYLVSKIKCATETFQWYFEELIREGDLMKIQWYFHQYREQCPPITNLLRIHKHILHKMMEKKNMKFVQWIMDHIENQDERRWIIEECIRYISMRGSSPEVYYLLQQYFPKRYSFCFHRLKIKYNELLVMYHVKIHIFREETIYTSSSFECGICYESKDIDFVWSNCHHVFCYSCLKQWFQKNHEMTCPLCRQIIWKCDKLIHSNHQ